MRRGNSLQYFCFLFSYYHQVVDHRSANHGPLNSLFIFKQLYLDISHIPYIHLLKVYSSMAFNIVPELCSHHCNQFHIFITPEGNAAGYHPALELRRVFTLLKRKEDYKEHSLHSA